MRLAEFLYKGSWRLVEPHLLGITKKGKLCLSAYQLQGGSAADWRAFLVSDIVNFNATGERFYEVRPGFNPNDASMVQIISSL
jgi:hypothetical protein